MWDMLAAQGNVLDVLCRFSEVFAHAVPASRPMTDRQAHFGY